MSRYVDVKWLEENAKEYSLGYYEDDEWATPLNVLDTAPSIDIVRCKECKWASPNKEGDYDCKCHIPIFRVDAEGYCYLADRKRSG